MDKDTVKTVCGVLFQKSNLKFFKYRLPDETTIIAPGISDTIFSWAKQLKKLEKVSIDYELKNHFNRLRADILYEILNTQGEYRRVLILEIPKRSLSYSRLQI